MKKQGQWRVLRIDLTHRKIASEEIGQEDLSLYMGGSGIAAKILCDETSAATDPLGAENRLIFMAGTFTGSPVPLSGRHAVVAKSPLTGIYGECDVGGSWGTAFKRTGYEGIIVTGQSPAPVYLLLTPEKLEIRDAGHLWGKDCFETDRLIKGETDPRTVVSCIGPAGERLARIAAIMSDAEHGRAAGRGGLGAVMGSKRLKAIAVTAGKKESLPADDPFRKSVKEILPQILEKGKFLREFGTAGHVVQTEAIGDLPIKNWRLGSWAEGAAKINGQVLAASMLSGRFACSNCVIGCGRVVDAAGSPYGPTAGGGPEYETLAALGSLCLVDDLHAVVKANELCNRYGLDTISTGGVIAFAMEAYENGALTRADLDGIDLKWGDGGALIQLLHKLGKREGIGALLSEGSRIAADRIGKGTAAYAIHVKGMEPPMHDPRAFTSLAVGYATSRIGASHWAVSHLLEKGMTMPALGYDAVQDRFASRGKGIMTAKMQDYMEMVEALKICKFIAWMPLAKILEWVSFVTGASLTPREYMAKGERISNLKRMYNVRCGITGKDDVLPARFLTLKRGTGGAADHLPDLPAMLAEYYEYRGWDENGLPRQEKLKTLGLLWMADGCGMSE
ncbi:MAG: aldehyde ferredoxin oxidoreductase family protein [Deltaproteobacteria bacterium]|nr:aldehyde ferredoxin oxidoreductase family protein [Deltaproteobacteria bacterium]